MSSKLPASVCVYCNRLHVLTLSCSSLLDKAVICPWHKKHNESHVVQYPTIYIATFQISGIPECALVAVQ
jgi:hypothetical protein